MNAEGQFIVQDPINFQERTKIRFLIKKYIAQVSGLKLCMGLGAFRGVGFVLACLEKI